ncbi:LysR family transcriptional regulator [Pararhizobium mangrovi]|uniref:HTH-type transcriptional regulator TtuA n=1 Tax=Pararhizobium mangrovi TaxID=2590452 RepID=A0A506UD18_9HYPH|nr:LysR family transcriptional regulator [Pararhizobium mangrovi]TPW30685.1 LysR family transcriptional regulator [Pararhizobium mangrovi]
MDTLTRMRAYIEVVDAEGFTAAARKLGRSKALLSKYVRELEDELGALLLNRTTRQFSLTEAGRTYYHRANDLVREIDELADQVREGNSDLKGKLRISAPRTFVDAEIGRSLIDFADRHPDIVLAIHADDRFVDLVEEGFDVAIRISQLEDSGLIARKLAPFALRLCATPAILEQHGLPTHPRDLSRLPCVVDTNSRSLNNWRFVDEDRTPFTVNVDGRIEVNSPIASMRAACAGLGFAVIPDFIADGPIETGALTSVLESFTPADRGIYAIYPHRRYLPAKTRTFVDALTEWFKANDRT